MTELTLTGLTKDFGRVRAVDGLTFRVPAGQVTGFLGPNGAGKTTTLRIMLGLIRPTAGTALVDGRHYADLVRPRTVVGAVLEATGFHPGRTGRDHLLIQAQAGRIPLRRVDEVLDDVDLTAAAGRRVGGYSLGMRQRLGLAAALLGDPAVLILDEPANGLDPGGMAWLRGLLRARAAAGGTILVSSHVLSEVVQTVDTVVMIHAGRLRFAGPLATLGGTAAALESAFLRLTSDASGENAPSEKAPNRDARDKDATDRDSPGEQSPTLAGSSQTGSAPAASSPAASSPAPSSPAASIDQR